MTGSWLQIDYSLAIRDGGGPTGGVPLVDFELEKPAFRSAIDQVLQQVDKGELGFWSLPSDAHEVERIRRYVAELDPEIRHVIVLGIGGSSLGPQALYHAIGDPPELRASSQAQRRLHFPDNSDPWRLAALLEALDPRQTLALAISKSGSTVETAAQVLIVRQWFEQTLGSDAMRSHMVVVTDPTKGPLRELAVQAQLQAFDIPRNVGGRFSVLSPVGLLPAELGGIDARAVQRGALELVEACRRPDLQENPAGLLAVLHTLHHRVCGRGIHVLMPYADALRPFAAWYVQLWAESLGKRVARDGRVVEQGPTPIGAIGATDQHAQVQLFMEGPRDKLVTFVAVKEPPKDLPIPTGHPPFDYLGGSSLAALLDAERRGTTLALARDGRPSLTLTITEVSPRTMGGLFFLFEAATALAGALYNVDAFDQPGVELGKRLAFGLLGRRGYEEERERVERAESGGSRGYRFPR